MRRLRIAHSHGLVARAVAPPEYTENNTVKIRNDSDNHARRKTKPEPNIVMIEWFRGHIERLQLQANVLRFWHRVVAIVCCVALVMQAAGWIVASAKYKLQGRHIASIAGFFLTIISLVLNYVSLNTEPQMCLMFGLQFLCLTALFLTATSAGTLAIVVDLCKWDQASTLWSCGATAMEYLASWVVCVCLCLIFAATQRKILMLVDRGILDGIGSRLSRLE